MDPCNSSVGTIAYMSPERINTDLNQGQYDGYAGDIWSLGVSILEFYLGKFPFGRQGDWASLMCAICMSQPPEAPPTASREFKDFISCCLQRDPARRWTAWKLLHHPFILQYASPGSNGDGGSNQVHQSHQLLPPPSHFPPSWLLLSANFFTLLILWVEFRNSCGIFHAGGVWFLHLEQEIQEEWQGWVYV